MILDPEQFSSHLQDYQRSAWRFECQPVYTMPREQPTLRAFLAGEPKPASHNTTWRANVAEMVAAGKSIGRVRTVQQPPTDYQRYQLAWGIPGNIEAGEDIRILDTTGKEYDLPTQDFWLFDDIHVVHLNFRSDGTLISIEQIEGPDLGRYQQWKTVALSHALPYSEYVARA